MIIYGYRNRESDVATGEFYCSRCQTRRAFKHKRMDRYFTLFFIPLFRLGRLGEYVECQTCFTTYKPDVLNLSVADVAIGESTGQVALQPALIRPVTPNYRRRGLLLALAGGGVFLCGGLLGLLITVAQFTDARGPDNNLEGFIGLLILCPVPLVVLGVVSLAAGVFIRLKHRQDADAA